ncbi:MAG: 16S rRNA (guanine(527)-N(7))-methyltransferase RsmG [Clostridiales bacterium]|jgi:16S rRNA (guanine(527)-N(7))-methyltransferase RsmG|nr:16S rRNA (guanine(527)-N(7))-methyltransferase RsmG [Clostridiales bacterium]
MTEFEARLKDLASQIGVELTEPKLSQFSAYATLLKEWNEKMNLTAITDDEGIIVKHFIDSLYLLKLTEIQQNSSLVDVGTGAGFPGVPLLIARPDLAVCLMDSTAKRLKFLEAVLTELHLKADTVHIRAEEAGQNKQFREKFDIACARAVAPLQILSEYCLPLVKQGGRFLSLKGKPESDEIKRGETAIKLLGGEKPQIIEYELINGDERTLIITKKISQTPSKYPRPSAKLAKKPLA